MKMRSGLYAAVAAMLMAVAAAPSSAQNAPADVERPRARLEGRLPLLEQALRLQDALELSPEQRTELAAIKSRLDAQNAPLVDQIESAMAEFRLDRDSVSVRDARGAGQPGGNASGTGNRSGRAGRRIGAAPGERGAVGAELASVLEEVRLNQAAALQEVTRLLTTEQLAELRSPRAGLRAERDGGRPERQNRGARPAPSLQ